MRILKYINTEVKEEKSNYYKKIMFYYKERVI